MSVGGDPAVFGAAATGIGMESSLFSLLEWLGFRRACDDSGEETDVLLSVRVKVLVL